MIKARQKEDWVFPFVLGLAVGYLLNMLVLVPDLFKIAAWWVRG